MDDVYTNIEVSLNYNPNKKLIILDDMLSNKKLNTIVTELVIRERKLNISLVFIMQCYFAVPRNIRVNKSFNKLHLIIDQILTFKTL